MSNLRINSYMNLITNTIAILISLSFLFTLADKVQAQISCRFTQITNTLSPTYNSRAVLSGDGLTIVFESNGDIVGNNPDLNQELYLYDVAGMTTDQITITTNPFMFVFSPSISNDGTRITFQSQANITGLNPDGSNELYLFDSNGGRTTQVTNNNTGGGAIDHVISPNGRKASLSSNFNITPPGNTDFNREIFLFDVSRFPYSVTQITRTTTTAGNRNASPSLNSNARLITFMSTADDLSPDNVDQSQEIFLFDSISSRFTQITNTTTVFNVFPQISRDGSHIVFISEADLTGDNPDGSQEKFLYDTGVKNFIQITDSEDHRTGYSRNFSIDADGSRVALEEDAKILLFDKDLMETVEIVEWGRWPSINGDGAKIAFVSVLDLTGENPDRNNEVFLADCSYDAVRPPEKCKVRTLSGPGHTLTLPFPKFVPVCRCLEDRIAREFRCALFNPDFFLVFRTPIPIFIDKPFEMSWTLIPLTKSLGDVYVDTTSPANFKLKDKKTAVMKFPSDFAVDRSSKVNLQFMAPEQQGNYPLNGRVMIKGKKGEKVFDQTFEFNVPVVKEESRK